MQIVCPKCKGVLWDRNPVLICQNHVDGEQYDIIGEKDCDFACKGEPNELELRSDRKAFWFYDMQGFLFEKILIVDEPEQKSTWVHEEDIVRLYERWVTYSGSSKLKVKV